MTTTLELLTSALALLTLLALIGGLWLDALILAALTALVGYLTPDRTRHS